MKLEFSRQFFEKYSNFVKIHPVGTELFHVDGQTDMTKEMSLFAIMWVRLKATGLTL
jgi:hypothetical protein